MSFKISTSFSSNAFLVFQTSLLHLTSFRFFRKLRWHRLKGFSGITVCLDTVIKYHVPKKLDVSEQS